ncbi:MULTISPECIES: DUF1015 domain-containing protein [Lachnospiraceae]|uniref:DUF1015 family protein n=1 Tax=Faecalicatena acetigenes TaxID=2981790 RepID=A0ABT2TEG3_9FIRM|nr:MULTISPECIES: DUF1015 family protein [Lachnospiraceae]MCU6748642.1 DUF1015 family protein [Faecalicatena acetigenes]SCI56117.1 Uncharacterized conserved protein [uncultured Clostridium sp.]
MTAIRPFKGIRPSKELVSSIAALPYDVYNRREAREITEKNPHSFLKIDRPETQFPEDADMYSQPVYDKAAKLLEAMLLDGSFMQDESPCYYVYALTMGQHTQTGIVGCASIDDYLNHIIRKHENTREEKELDRIRHVDTLSAQTGPIFLAYRPHAALKILLEKVCASAPLYDFVSDDSIRHQVWQIKEINLIEQISQIFSSIEQVYIADGHHRAASAVKVGLMRRDAHPDYTGTEEFNYFLSVLFSSDELQIFDYNRVITDLNGYTFTELLTMIEKHFHIQKIGSAPFHPQKKGQFGLYGNGNWYCLEADPCLYSDSPVEALDVSVLQNFVLAPILQIQDPKTDPRIHFVGGIRGLHALQEEVDKTKGIAFSMYPTSMEELLAVADANLLMPPKSTWFEPKLRSGLFIHQIEH